MLLFIVCCYCFGRCFDGDLISSAIEDRTQTIKPGRTHRPPTPVVLRLLVLLVVVLLLAGGTGEHPEHMVVVLLLLLLAGGTGEHPEHMVVAEWPLAPHPRALLWPLWPLMRALLSAKL